MKPVKVGIAGTLESSDAMITISPQDTNSIEIELESPVAKTFGVQIREVILERAQALNLDSALIRVQDRGALDAVLKARMTCAVHRALDITEKINWEELSS